MSSPGFGRSRRRHPILAGIGWAAGVAVVLVAVGWWLATA